MFGSPRRLRRLVRAIRRLRRRSPVERRTVLRALGVTALMWLAVRAVSVRRIVRWTEVPSGSARTMSSREEARILWAVAAVNRRLFPDRPCLTQALAARYLLSRGGVPSVLQIGVTRDGSELQAHAWLEREGGVIIGGEQSPARYRRLGPG
jgi:hypothetical protein